MPVKPHYSIVDPYYISGSRSGLFHKIIAEDESDPNHIVVQAACGGLELFKHEGKITLDYHELKAAGKICYNCQRSKC